MHRPKDRKLGWNELEHLLIIRWVIPRIIKLMLEPEGRYDLTNVDIAEFWMFDRWLNCRDWYQDADERHAMVSIMRGVTWGTLLSLLRDIPTSDLIRSYLQDEPGIADCEEASDGTASKADRNT